MWDKGCEREPECTKTKREAGTVAPVRKDLVVMGNDGEEQVGSREW